MLGLTIAVLGPIGDLFESLVKRDAGAKDAGRLFGAHGGALDRLDAISFTVVAAYFIWAVADPRRCSTETGRRTMREIVLRVRAGVAEAVLDRLLPIVPAGVREMRSGEDVELRMRGAGLPALAEVAQLVRRWPHTLSEREVPDDWRDAPGRRLPPGGDRRTARRSPRVGAAGRRGH